MGRKRSPGKREKSGKLSRKPEDIAARRQVAWDLAQKDAVSTVLEARQRLYGLDEEKARDQKAGSFIGRLCMGREISRSQYEALCMWEESARANAAVSCGPPPDKAFDPNRVAGLTLGDDERRDAAIRARHLRACEAVQAKQIELRGSANLFAALYECVQRDREVFHLIGDLRAAANALVRHYGLEARQVA